MENFNKIGDVVTVDFEEKPIRILNAFCLGPIKAIRKYEKLNCNLFNIFNSTLLDSKYDFEKPVILEGEKHYWYFYDKLEESKNVQNTRFDFKSLSMRENERLFLYAKIRCSQEKITYWSLSKLEGKIWINGNLSFMSDDFKEYEFRVRLNQGDNIVIIELHRPSNFNLIVRNPGNSNEKYSNSKILNTQFDSYVKNSINIAKDTKSSDQDYTFSFSVIPKDFINIDHKTPIKIKILDNKNQMIDKFFSEFNKQITYCLFNNKNGIPFSNYIFLIIEYKNKFNETFEKRVGILINNLRSLINHIENQFIILQENYVINSKMISVFNGLVGDLKIIPKGENDCLAIEKLQLLSDLQHTIKTENELKDFIKKRKVLPLYYISELDNQLEKIYVAIPTEYNSNKKYPIILIASTNVHEDFILFKKHVEHIVNKLDVIVGYIYQKGVTTGSYIGEVSLLEGFNFIKSLINIDEERIYLTGNSNGAFATWALAQAYPEIFAAIAPISGRPYYDNLMNISHIPIFNMTGTNDVFKEKSYYEPLSFFEEYGNHTGVLFEETNHSELAYFRYNTEVFEWLLQHRKTSFPNKIKFRTERMKHRKTSWGEILEFDKGKSWASFELTLSNNTVKINLRNITKFILQLPDNQFGENKINQVEINNNFINIDSKICSTLTLQNVSNKFEIIKTALYQPLINDNLGFGILGVYLGPLKIVIPSNFNNEIDRKAIRKAAENFANPVTNGFKRAIDINYPIISEKRISSNDIKFNNFIVINIISNNIPIKFQNEIIDIPINCDERGYEYNGVYTPTDYYLMYTRKSPYSSRLILYIFTNSPEFFSKHFYIRNIILYSYSNGLHPLFNKDLVLVSRNETISANIE